MVIELYPDQLEALEKVLAAYKSQPKGGHALLVAPTAWGKTIFFSSLARELAGMNILIVAHRDELLNQAREKYLMFDPTAIVGKVGGGIHEYGAPITVAGIDTISQPKHLKNLHKFGYEMVIWDEAHHCQASKYHKVRAALADAFHVGVTATPDRLDGKSLSPLFGKPVFSMNIVEAIQKKRLCDVKAIAIRTEVSLDNIHSSKNSDGEVDFNQRALEEAVDTPARNRRVVEAYLEHAKDRRAICFAVSVEHAQSLAYTFNDFGIPAAVVSGDTDHKERARLYNDLRLGKLKVLCNVLVLTEGFDLPLIDCVIMARPTQSQSLYIQCIGRGMRLAPNKEDCLILDLTDNSMRLRLSPQNFKQAIQLDLQNGELVTDALVRIEREKAEKEAHEKRAIIRKLNEKRDKDVVIDLFALPEWQERENGLYVLEVGPQKHRIAIAPCPSNEWAQFYDVYARLAPDFIGQRWMSAHPLDRCLQEAEKRARMLLNGEAELLAKRSAKWQEPITERQQKYLNWKKIPWQPGMTKAEASRLIDEDKQKVEARKLKQQARSVERAMHEEVKGDLYGQPFSLLRRDV